MTYYCIQRRFKNPTELHLFVLGPLIQLRRFKSPAATNHLIQPIELHLLVWYSIPHPNKKTLPRRTIKKVRFSSLTARKKTCVTWKKKV